MSSVAPKSSNQLIGQHLTSAACYYFRCAKLNGIRFESVHTAFGIRAACTRARVKTTPRFASAPGQERQLQSALSRAA